MIYPIVILAMDNPQDRAFMENLYNENAGLMYSQAIDVLGDRREYADDVVSDAILRLIDKVELIRTFECYILRSYIVSTIRRTALNHLKKQGRLNKRFIYDDGTELAQHASDDPDVDAELLRRVEVDELKSAIRRLKPSDQRILEMKYILQMSNVQIASELQIGVDSVRPCLQRVRRRAYKIMKEEMHDE